MAKKISEINKKLKSALNVDKEGKKPYVSINKLAEYMTANAIRRRQIIKILKKDSDFYKVYYSEVRNVIPKFFKSNYDSDILDVLITKIEEKVVSTDWEKNDNSNSIIAIQNVLESNLPDLSNYNFIKDDFKIKKIELAGVTVTIKPDLFLQNKDNSKIGVLKHHIAKTPDNQLEDENRIYVATILKFALLEHGLEEKNIDDNACIAFDIFKKDYSTSSKSFKRTISAVEAACEEIALRWETI